MKIVEYYEESRLHGHDSLTMFIDFLVYEKRAVKMEDDEEKLNYYLQDRFHNRMNEYLAEYKKVWSKERIWNA